MNTINNSHELIAVNSGMQEGSNIVISHLIIEHPVYEDVTFTGGGSLTGDRKVNVRKMYAEAYRALRIFNQQDRAGGINRNSFSALCKGASMAELIATTDHTDLEERAAIGSVRCEMTLRYLSLRKAQKAAGWG